LRIVALYVGSSLTISYFVNDIQGYDPCWVVIRKV
jgi:hypothetical protein